MNAGIRPLAPERREEVLRRLRRIEGQVRGIQRMVTEGRDCRDIVHQIAAIRQALASANSVVLECYAQNCLSDPDNCRAETISELIELFKDVC
ncbi:metal-sensitive transcriptional regulator [Chloroflexus sp. MS-CIW-1]|jgi:DNA-binding FrmR family transcriptional regulator|uniref:metal-sensitive transcriptional regulator n=1 Tax=unclassified Chloroflexus TaxID=2633855 RepID=UPI00048B83A7|nr:MULTISPECIES: metal-sensitive transcriptional regulator [unclassified Chloroflexus]MBO9313103.1 metal-sensitive transcriptional regulator [Chloroflexus sp.]MBO9347676.1 metal-sensitive transcriptional regulator [Chloroflexus sp.]MBO9374765.1 metal-sensitive transcriptional regulator [Chloroflexus sp.]MDN5273313.1 metal-sensitive transcriptional regulator [Chloroflexus sp. MS-CIW-1]